MDRELSTDSGLTLASAQITDAGDRQLNQDALASAERDGLACFVISDGAGGHVGGEIASNIVIHAVIEGFLNELSFGSRALQFYVEHAITQVASGKVSNYQLKNMSATVAAVLIDKTNRSVLCAHLGDTRVYLFQDGKVSFFTRDHSLVQQYVDAGYCPPEALRSHPKRGVLYAAVGAEGDTSPTVSKENVALNEGDAILLCTDGFWEWITESEMEQCLGSADTVEIWLRNMREIVEKNGKISKKFRDNYTAQAIWLNVT